MCASCGCGELNNDHGDDRNITMRQIEAAADASGRPVPEVAENMERAVEVATQEGLQEAPNASSSSDELRGPGWVAHSA
jgi:hypothetical protein